MRKINFTYGMQFPNFHPPPSVGSLSGSSPAFSATPLENYTPPKNPPSPVPNVPNDPDSDPDPNSSDCSSSGSYYSFDYRDVKFKNVHVRNVGIKDVRLGLLKSAPFLQSNYLCLHKTLRLRS